MPSPERHDVRWACDETPSIAFPKVARTIVLLSSGAASRRTSGATLCHARNISLIPLPQPVASREGSANLGRTWAPKPQGSSASWPPAVRPRTIGDWDRCR